MDESPILGWWAVVLGAILVILVLFVITAVVLYFTEGPSEVRDIPFGVTLLGQ